MKLLVVAVIALTSSLSFASEFRCLGQGYSVLLRNHVQPANGTKNAAVLVVSAPQVGTITRLLGSEILTSRSDRAVQFEGQSRGYSTGRFMYTTLLVAKQPGADGLYFAKLTLNTDGGTHEAKLACAYILKSDN